MYFLIVLQCSLFFPTGLPFVIAHSFLPLTILPHLNPFVVLFPSHLLAMFSLCAITSHPNCVTQQCLLFHLPHLHPEIPGYLPIRGLSSLSPCVFVIVLKVLGSKSKLNLFLYFSIYGPLHTFHVPLMGTLRVSLFSVAAFTCLCTAFFICVPSVLFTPYFSLVFNSLPHPYTDLTMHHMLTKLL